MPTPYDAGGVPPWEETTTITESQLAFLTLRQGKEDYERILKVLKEQGSLTVVPDA